MSERRTQAETTPALPEAEAVAAALAMRGVNGLCPSCHMAFLRLLAVQTLPGVEPSLVLLSCSHCGAVVTHRTDVLGV